MSKPTMYPEGSARVLSWSDYCGTTTDIARASIEAVEFDDTGVTIHLASGKEFRFDAPAHDERPTDCADWWVAVNDCARIPADWPQPRPEDRVVPSSVMCQDFGCDCEDGRHHR